ncbi:MAG: diguanylate cyclase [Candidatus Aminicenantes bacterium]|nr:diguanylate cyclase [Candidatus Aminicenantes bacterium]
MADKPIGILIAEDDRISARILDHHVKKWGFETRLAFDGLEAWNLLTTEALEMALLDWVMPGINGLELCRRLRQKNELKEFEYTYIILLTAKDERQDLIEGLNAGADDYVTKPFDLFELKARLNAGRRIVELYRLLKKQATIDSLTGLLNRRRILEEAEKEYHRAKRENRPVGLLLIDIDDFKKVNDSFGHLAGDALLTEVATRLKKRVRNYDQIGRYGGDEILAVFPGCETYELKRIADRLCLAVKEKPVYFDQHELIVSISAGGLSFNHLSSLSLRELIALCDRALYQAKKRGRNRSLIIESIVLNKGGQS